MTAAPSEWHVTCPSSAPPLSLSHLQLSALRSTVETLEAEKKRTAGDQGGDVDVDGGDVMRREIESKAKSRGRGAAGANRRASKTKSAEEEDRDIADFEDELR